MIGFAVDAEVVEAVAAGQRIATEEERAPCAPLSKERRSPLAEQIAVAQLVDRVLQIEPAQQRIGRHFGGAKDVAPAVGLDFREREQLPQTAIGIGPHPSMKGPHDPIERAACHRHVESFAKRSLAQGEHRGSAGISS